jgi:hypothetical protein
LAASSVGFLVGYHAFDSWIAACAALTVGAAYSEAKKRQRLADAIVKAEAGKTADSDGKFTFTRDEIAAVVQDASGPHVSNTIIVWALIILALVFVVAHQR